MKWRGQTLDQRQGRLRDWHTAFAWMPVQSHDGTWIWLEQYQRRALAFSVLGAPLWQIASLSEERPSHPFPQSKPPARK